MNIKAIWVLDPTVEGVSNFFERFNYFADPQAGVNALFRYHTNVSSPQRALVKSLSADVRAGYDVNGLAQSYRDIVLLKPVQNCVLAADLNLVRGTKDKLQSVLRIYLQTENPPGSEQQYRLEYMSMEYSRLIIDSLGLELNGEMNHPGFESGTQKMLLLRNSAENSILLVLEGLELEYSITVG